MSKKVEPTEYLDEDYLFLILQLIDHPKLKRDKLTFSEIKKEKYAHAMASDLFYEIVNLNDQGLLKIEKLKFNVSEGNRDDREFIQAAQSAIKKHPKLKLAQATKKIINNNFSLRDLKIVLPYEHYDHIFNFINFDIKISKKFKQEHAKWLKKYLKLFAGGKLESSTKNYLEIESQKKDIKKIINEISKKTGSTLVLRDSYFGNKYRFFENILLLEKEKFLIIKNISSEEVNRNSADYLIHCELKEKRYSYPPFCETEKGIGFLKFSEKEERIKIGGSDSRHFKLLKLLLKEFGRASSISYAFDYIKTDKDNRDPNINNLYLGNSEKIRILENARKELQKKDRLRGQLKITIDKSSKIIWIDYIK